MLKKILSLALALMLLMLPCAMASEAANTLKVTGTASVSVPTDAAMIVLGVRETAGDVQEAQATVNNNIAAIRTALTGIGIDNRDIVTDSLYIYANYSYDSEVERIVAYTATNTLCITVNEISRTGEVIDTAFSAGANVLDNVEFFATDISAASDKAYTDAVADALHKAQVIADAAGMSSTAIIDITEGTTDTWIDNATKMRAGNFTADEAAAGTDIQQSNAIVTANVIITFAIAP